MKPIFSLRSRERWLSFSPRTFARRFRSSTGNSPGEYIQRVKVDLPNAGAKPIDPAFLQKHEPLIVTIDARGQLYVNFGPNPDKPASEATVSARTAALLRRDRETPVLVKADTTVPYGAVAHAMVLLQRAGADKVGLLTDPERPAPRIQGESRQSADGTR